MKSHKIETYTIDDKEYKAMVDCGIPGNCIINGDPFRWVVCSKCRHNQFKIIKSEIVCKNCGKGSNRFVDCVGGGTASIEIKIDGADNH